MTPLPPDPLLTVITDDSLSPARVEAIAAEACGAGPITVQLRARGWSGREVHSSAERLRETTRRAGCRLVVHDRMDVAIAVAADGVHLPSSGIDARRARSLLDARRPLGIALGVSVHSVEEIRALAGIADSVQFGPVFETPSKRQLGRPQGVDALRLAVRAARASAPRLRVIAVGGINEDNVGEVLGAGADGAAVIGAVMRAGNPAAAVRTLLALISRARA